MQNVTRAQVMELLKQKKGTGTLKLRFKCDKPKENASPRASQKTFQPFEVEEHLSPRVNQLKKKSQPFEVEEGVSPRARLTQSSDKKSLDKKKDALHNSADQNPSPGRGPAARSPGEAGASAEPRQATYSGLYATVAGPAPAPKVRP